MGRFCPLRKKSCREYLPEEAAGQVSLHHSTTSFNERHHRRCAHSYHCDAVIAY